MPGRIPAALQAPPTSCRSARAQRLVEIRMVIHPERIQQPCRSEGGLSPPTHLRARIAVHHHYRAGQWVLPAGPKPPLVTATRGTHVTYYTILRGSKGLLLNPP